MVLYNSRSPNPEKKNWVDRSGPPTFAHETDPNLKAFAGGDDGWVQWNLGQCAAWRETFLAEENQAQTMAWEDWEQLMSGNLCLAGRWE